MHVTPKLANNSLQLWILSYWCKQYSAVREAEEAVWWAPCGFTTVLTIAYLKAHKSRFGQVCNHVCPTSLIHNELKYKSTAVVQALLQSRTSKAICHMLWMSVKRAGLLCRISSSTSSSALKFNIRSCCRWVDWCWHIHLGQFPSLIPVALLLNLLFALYSTNSKLYGFLWWLRLSSAVESCDQWEHTLCLFF